MFASSVSATACTFYPFQDETSSSVVLLTTRSSLQISQLPLQTYRDSYCAVFEKTASSTDARPDFTYSGKAYDGSGTATDLTDLALIASSLSAAYEKPNGVLPYLKTLWEKDTAPLLKNRGDLLRLKTLLCYDETQDAVTLILSDKIFMNGSDAVPSLFSTLFAEDVDDENFLPVRIAITGKESVLELNGSDLFAKGFDAAMPDVLLNDVGLHYDYDVSVTASDISADTVFAGTGAKNDPYFLTCAEELVGFMGDGEKNATGKYAVLGKNIFVNSYGKSGRKLHLGTLYASLNGCGYGLIGLSDECLFVEVKGAVFDLSVYVYGEKETDCVFAETLSGRAENIALYGTQDAVCGFFQTVNGTAERCLNALSCEYAFCETFGKDGTLKNCLATAGTAFAGTDDGKGCAYCIATTSEGYTLLNGKAVKTQDADDIVLRENGYDTDTVFGYEIGLPDTFPSFRKEGVEYKRKNEESFVIEDGTYGDAEFAIADVSDVFENYHGLTWKYNGVAATVSDGVLEAGSYEGTLLLSGTTELLPEKRVFSFTVKQATCPVKIGSTTVSTEVSFTYTGAEIPATAEEKDTVMTTLQNTYGYTISFEYTALGTSLSRSEIVGAGTYNVKYAAESKNYVKQTWDRKVTVTKAVLSVVVSDGTVRYNEETDYSDFTVTATFLGRDVGKTLDDFLPKKATTYLTSSYTAGEKTGKTFAVSFVYAGITLNDYQWDDGSIQKGKLTVVKALLPQGDISFYGATAKKNGSSLVTYTGEEQTWQVEGVPNGFSVSYDKNAYTDAGNYTVSATISDKNGNYQDLVLTVDVTVAKAELTVAAKDLSKEYGYAVAFADFSGEGEGLLGEDTLASLGVLFLPYNGSTPIAEGSVLSIGTYRIAASTASEAKNYQITFEDGEFTVTKISLTALYKNNQGLNENFDDKTVTYSGEAFSRTLSFFEKDGYTVSYTYAGLKKTSVTDAGTYLVRATVTPKEPSDYAETVYTCTLTILKKKTKIAFTQKTFLYTYVPGGTVNYAQESYCPYQKEDIPDGYSIDYSCDYENAVRAGTYQMRVAFAGDKNLEGAQDTATLTVTPFTAEVSLTRSYTYQASKREPVVTVVGSTEVKAELPSSVFAFSYIESVYGTVLQEAVSVGIYTVYVACKNADYVLRENEFEMEIEPLMVDITIGNLTFTYGTSGEIVDNGVHYEIQEDYITRYDYYVAETDATVEEITFRLSPNASGRYFPANVYELKTEYIVQKGNYRFRFATGSTNRVTVKQRVLTNVWMLDGNIYPYANLTLVYSGTKQNGRFTSQTDNYAAGQNAGTVGISVTIQSGGTYKDLYGVGVYKLTVSSKDKNNYSVEKETESLTVYIQKADLHFWIEDVSVQQYETFGGMQYRTEGLVGADEEKDVKTLEGAKIRQICGYTVGSKAGSTYEIDMSATFDNYNAVVEKKGTLSVLKSAYGEYVLRDTAYTYDGTPKSITLTSVDYGVTVSYSGNNKVDTGVYTVVATVTYPTGRVTTTTAKLTILQAVPSVSVEPYFTVYRRDTLLTEDVIQGRALAGEREIEGSFSFRKQENKLSENENTYAVVFTPKDTHNFASVVTDLTITAYQVSGYLLQYGGSYTWSSGNLVIDGNVTVRLDTEAVSGIADKLSFRKNGQEVRIAVLDTEETVELSVWFEGEQVYATTFAVLYYTEEEPEKTVIDESFFALIDIQIDSKKEILYVGDGGGRIALSEKATEEYSLYVNGNLVGKSGYVVLKSDDYVSVILQHSRYGTVYSHVFTVKDVSERETIEPTPEKEGLATYWYGIFGGVGGVLVVGIVLLIVFKKKH